MQAGFQRVSTAPRQVWTLCTPVDFHVIMWLSGHHCLKGYDQKLWKIPYWKFFRLWILAVDTSRDFLEKSKDSNVWRTTCLIVVETIIDITLAKQRNFLLTHISATSFQMLEHKVFFSENSFHFPEFQHSHPVCL